MDLDSLQIELTASEEQAVSAIDALISSLQGLDGAFSSAGEIKEFSGALRDLAAAAKGISVKDFQKIPQAFAQLKREGSHAAIKQMSDDLAILNTRISKYVDKSDGMGSAYLGGLDKLASSISNVAAAAQTVDTAKMREFSSAVNSMINASAKVNGVAQAMQGVQKAAASPRAAEEAKKLAEAWNISDKGVIDDLTDSMQRMFDAVSNGADTREEQAEIESLIRSYGRLKDELSEREKQAADWWRSIDKVRVPSDFFSTFGAAKGNDVRGTLGIKKMVSDPREMEFDSVMQEMKSQFPDIFDGLYKMDELVLKLVEVLRRAKDGVISFAEAEQEGYEQARYLKETIEDMANQAKSEIMGDSLDEFIYKLQEANTQISITSDNMKNLTVEDMNLWGRGFQNIEGIETAPKSAVPFDTLASDINQTYGTSIQTLHDFFNVLQQAHSIFPQFAQSTQSAVQGQQDFATATQQTAQSVQQATTGLQDDPFGKIAEGLKGFEGINIPDMSNLAAIAAGIRGFGHEASLQAASNLPALAQGLRQLDGLTVPAADFTLFANGVSLLGRKNISNAAMNLPFLADGLRALQGVTVPNLAGIGELASAISRLGAANAEKAVQNIPALASAFRNLITTLRGAGPVSSNTVALANAMANLSGNTLRAGNAAQSATPKLINFGKAAKNTSRHSFSLASAIGKVYAGYWLLFRGMGKIRDAIDISSDLTEVQNVVDQTFGDLAYKVEDAAKTSIQSLGMSELMMKQISSRFQSMGTSMGISNAAVAKSSEFLKNNSEMYGHTANSMADMSLELTKLAADLGSFYNMDYEEVAQKMESIFTGQTRPLRTFGLDLTQATLQEWAMKQGMDVNIKTMSQAEKTMLRYQYVLANTAAAQGDFTRTANTWANQTRILGQQFQQLGAIIGGALINTIKPLVQWMTGAMNTIISLVQRTVNAIGKLMGWQMEITDVGIAMDDSMEDYSDSIDDATDSAKKLNRQLMQFDKLNVITTQKDNGKGGLDDALGGGLGDMGRGRGGEVSFKPYESDVVGWFDLGRRISDALAGAMEDIDWQRIYEKFRNAAHNLADFLNGLFTPRLFEGLGRTIAGALNTAFHFLDEFGETFNFWNFGNSFAAGLNKFMKDLDWTTILSAARNWGKGIANTINGFISRADFESIGRTIANALNTALTFLGNFAETLDFERVGRSIGDAINGFFRNFNFQKLARTINKWAHGILDTIIAAIKRTDWDLIGRRLGQFLIDLDFIGIGKKVGKAIWEAINAGFDAYASMFKKAPLETALLTLGGALALLKVKPVRDFIGAVSGAVGTVLTFIGLLGSQGLFGAITTVFPKATGIVNAFLSGFQTTMLMFASGHGVFTSFVSGLEAVGAAMSPVAKFFVTIGGGLAEFLMVKDAVHDLAAGTGNVGANIAELLGGLAIGGAALTAVFGFPAGTIAAGVIGLVAVFEGLDKAWKEAAEAVDQMTFDNFIEGTKAVGDAAHTLDDYRVAMHNTVDSIVQPLDKLRDKFEEIGRTKDAIGEVVTEFEALSIAVGNGFDLSGEIENVSSSFAELDRLMKEHINAKYDYLITAEMTDMAYLASTGRLTEAEKKEYEKRITAFYGAKAEMTAAWEDASGPMKAATEAHSAAVAEFGAGSAEAMAAAEEIGRAAVSIADNLGEMGIATGTATDSVNESIDKMRESFSNLRGSLDLSSDGLKDYVGVYEAYSSTWAEVSDTWRTGSDDLRAQLESINEDIKNATGVELESLLSRKKKIEMRLQDINEVYLYSFGMMQQDLVEGIGGVVRAAGEEWDKNGGVLGRFYSSKEEYEKSKVQEYVNSVINPLDSEFKTQLGDLQTEASGYAKDAAKGIVGSVFDTENVFDNYGLVETKTSIVGNWQDIINESVGELQPEVPAIMAGMWDGAGRDIAPTVQTEVSGALGTGVTEAMNETQKIIEDEAPALGKAIPDGMAEGINSNESGFWSKIKGVFTGIIEKVKGIFKSHSPSLVFKSIGGDLMGGMSLGITGKASEIISSLKTVAGNMVTAFTGKLGEIKEAASGVFGTMKTNIDTQMSNIKSSLGGKLNEIKTAASTAWQNLQTDATTKWNAIKTNISTAVGNIKTSATTEFNTMKTNISSALEGIKTVASTAFDGIKTAATNAMTGAKTAVENGLSSLKTAFSGVTDFFGEIGSSIGNSFEGLQEKMGTVAEGIGGAFDGLKDVAGKVKDTVGETVSGMIESVKDGVKEVNETVGKTTTKKVEVKVKSQSGRIARFASGGFPEDGLFFANHNELVGRFSNGKTAVANNQQIVEGIQSGVEVAMNRSMGRYLRYLPEIADSSAQTARKPVLSSRDVFSAVRSEDNAHYQRTGQPSFNF